MKCIDDSAASCFWRVLRLSADLVHPAEWEREADKLKEQVAAQTIGYHIRDRWVLGLFLIPQVT